MAISHTLLHLLLCTTLIMSTLVISQPSLNMVEQESVYTVLNSINSEISWRSLFPDDFCSNAPHGVVCEFFVENDSNAVVTAHITELSFGYVSDYNPNPPCTPKSTFNASLFSPLSHLRKIFVYKCFTETNVSFPDFSSLPSSLEELIFIENPSLVGSMGAQIGNNLTSLRRLVVSGSGVSGEIYGGLGDFLNLEQVTISRNMISGEIPVGLEKLKKLRVLDLSQNMLEGNVPESIGNLTQLLKLDLSYNQFSGKIPESIKNLKRLEFLDLSYNSFAKVGVPLFLAEMLSLREVYLSGNFLGGQIPDIWKKLDGIVRIGLSRTGLIGNIPASMGLYLKNLCYLGLDNNMLEGTVPQEFESLESVNELHLEHNNLSGRVPFTAKFVSKIGEKLKLEGNSQLCVDQVLKSAKLSDSLGHLALCNIPEVPKSVTFSNGLPLLPSSYVYIVLGILFIVF